MTLTREESIPNRKLREFAKREQLGGAFDSWEDLAQWAGITNLRSGGELRGDVSTLKRMLGINKHDGIYRERISREKAARIVRALDGWPVDFGL